MQQSWGFFKFFSLRSAFDLGNSISLVFCTNCPIAILQWKRKLYVKELPESTMDIKEKRQENQNAHQV